MSEFMWECRYVNQGDGVYNVYPWGVKIRPENLIGAVRRVYDGTRADGWWYPVGYDTQRFRTRREAAHALRMMLGGGS